MAIVVASMITSAQEIEKGLQLGLKGGYDYPFFDNNTPYVDYTGGLSVEGSIDYFWSKWGIGLDYNYISNNAKNAYPTENLSDHFGNIITNITTFEDGIRRTFLGMGPAYKLLNKNKLSLELAARGGISDLKGGQVLVEGEVNNVKQMLNYHAGYDQKRLLSGKGEVRFNYQLNTWLGVGLNVYYLHHFNVEEDNINGLSAYYQPVEQLEDNFGFEGNAVSRAEACDCNISSVGAVIGVNIRFPKGQKDEKCGVCNNTLTVTAKDKISGQLLPETDVILLDSKGDVRQSAKTNVYGVVVFNDIPAEDYTIKGNLYGVELTENSIMKSEFKTDNSVQKELLYTDESFILKGRVVECNTVNPIQGVDVILRNTTKAGQKNTLTNESGVFSFQIDQNSIYKLKGKKDGYISNEVELSSNDYDREKTLIIDFEMCVDPCGVAIRLDHINFALDKWDILDEAKPDLQRVINIMKSNPEITVEMSSHTDSRGSNDYNQELSQKRANSTVDYLMKNGVEKKRLSARGAGELELLNKCADGVKCPESDHKKNRRTEFKIICP